MVRLVTKKNEQSPTVLFGSGGLRREHLLVEDEVTRRRRQRELGIRPQRRPPGDAIKRIVLDAEEEVGSTVYPSWGHH